MPEVQPTYYARLHHETMRVGGCVIDGDTLIVERLLNKESPRLKEDELRIRLLEVDTADHDNPQAMIEATAFTGLWLWAANKEWTKDLYPFVMQTTKHDSFGRMLAWIFRRDTGESLSEALIAAGHSERIPVLGQLKAAGATVQRDA